VDITLAGLEAVARDLKDLRPFLTAIGERARDVILEEGRHDSGGDLQLSHFGRGGRRGRVRMDVETEFGTGSVTLRAVPPGPWMLMEAGSHKGDWIIPRKGSRTKAVVLPDGSVRRYVHHGPVRARNTFTRARKRIEDQLPAWGLEVLSDRLAKVA